MLEPARARQPSGLGGVEPFDAMSSSSKKPRLLSFGRRSHVSHQAMARLFKQVEDEGLPGCFSASAQARHKDRVALQQTSFGPLLQKVSVPSGEVGAGARKWMRHVCPTSFGKSSPHQGAKFSAQFARASGVWGLR